MAIDIDAHQKKIAAFLAELNTAIKSHKSMRWRDALALPISRNRSRNSWLRLAGLRDDARQGPRLRQMGRHHRDAYERGDNTFAAA